MFDGATKAPDEAARGEYSTDLFTRKAVEAIGAHFGGAARAPASAAPDAAADAARASAAPAAAPFFLYLAYQAPHAPVQPAPGFNGTAGDACRDATTGEGRDVYCSMVTRLDAGVGRVVDALRAPRGGAAASAAPPWNSTVLVFTTDNGGCFPDENRGCNWPLRGGKHHNFEGGIRGVGFVHSPLLRGRAGHASRALMHATDWFPTLLGLADRAAPGGGSGGPPPPLPAGLDGFDVWAALVDATGATPSPRAELVVNADPLANWTGGVRVGALKLLVGDLDVGWLRCDMTLVAPPPRAPGADVLLFNLTADPNETTDLSADPAHADDLARLLARYEEIKAETVDPHYPPSDPKSYPDTRGLDAWYPWL